MILALAAAAFLVHARSLGYEFSPLDDDLLIVNRVKWLADPSNLAQAFREGVFLGKERNFYRPLLTVTLFGDTLVGGGAAWAYHLTNVLLHVVAVLLVLATLVRLGARWSVAWILALLFAVHPAFTHAVAWIPGRNDTLLAVLLLGSFLCFERWAAGGGVGWGAAHLALFFLSLLTKETAVLLPALLLLRVWLVGARRRIAVLTAGWLLAVFTWIALLRAYGGPPAHFARRIAGEFFAALVQLYGKLFAPLEQSVVPVVRDSSLVPGLLALAATAGVAVALGFRDRRSAVFGLAWFIAFLALPTLAGSTGIVMPIHHEHRLYLPAVGFLAAVAQLRFERLRPLRRWLAPAIAVLALAAAAKTIARSAVYENRLAFASDAVASSPSLAVSYKMRGDALTESKEHALAIADFDRALSLRPGYAAALSGLGKAHYEAGRPAQALEWYGRAIAAEPDDIENHNNRGFVYLMTDDLARAIQDLDFVLARAPRNSKALNNRGKAMIFAGHRERAVADLTAAIEIDAGDGEAYHNRAVAYYYLKDWDRAWADVEQARRLGVPLAPALLEALRRDSGR